MALPNPFHSTLHPPYFVWQRHNIVKEVPIRVCSLEERSTQECCRTLRECTSTLTSPYGNNSLFISSHFLKINISMETWEHIKLGELPKHNALRFFYWGRSLKIKKELFTLHMGDQNLNFCLYIFSISNAISPLVHNLKRVKTPLCGLFTPIHFISFSWKNKQKSLRKQDC
jgi:hypothetical protein